VAQYNFHFSTNKSTIEGFGSIMKKCMNMLSSNKIIAIQEALYSTMEMPLTLSSEYPYYLNTSTRMKLSFDHQGPTLFDLKSAYANRGSELHSMTLAEFFYKIQWDKISNSNTSNKGYLKDSRLVLHPRNPFIIPCGRNVKCVFPVTFEYAKAMMIMYVPWSDKNNLNFSDKSATITEFERLIASKSFPTSVIAQYRRAEMYHKHNKIEVVSKKSIPIDICQYTDQDEYSDYQIFVRAMNHFTNDKPVPSSIGDMSFNVGLNYD
jgi:hypothetical protein